MLLTKALDYDLPEHLIATTPAEPRERARLMVVWPDRVEHLRVADLPDLVEPGDALILNQTQVLPARFRGRAIETGGFAEGLWLGDATQGDALTWHLFLKARRLRAGTRFELLDRGDRPSGYVLELIRRVSDDGVWEAAVEGGHTTPEVLNGIGLTPLPPYIRGARARAGEIVAEDADRRAYQTVVAIEARNAPVLGSVAAPTAGLHFTRELLEAIESRGVRRGEVVLQVGAGTFKPIESEFVEQHVMHREWCSLGGARWAMDHPGRVVAVGSTSARTLESYGRALRGGEQPGAWMETDLLIAPGYAWERVDVLLTNFHLPRSTLLAMVAAIVPGGVERLRALYAEAVMTGYRFYSYGDAMLIVPKIGSSVCAPERR